MIIGIGHKARHGKDTAAEHLQSVFGCDIIHFADALYDECRNATVLYNENTNTLYLKTYDEDFYELKNPSEAGIEWITQKGVRKTDLPHEAQWFYDGMKEKDPQMLQFYGTEYRRKLFEWDYWVNKTKQYVLANPDTVFIIPDTRFKNEAAFIKKMGGEIWKVIRPGLKLVDRDPNHTSEIDLDDWEFDEVIINDGTIEDLYKKTEEVYRRRILKG